MRSRHFKTLEKCCNEIEEVTENIVQRTKAAEHFDTTATTIEFQMKKMKIKLHGTAWRDELAYREMDNKLQREIERLHEAVRKVNKQQYVNKELKVKDVIKDDAKFFKKFFLFF